MHDLEHAIRERAHQIADGRLEGNADVYGLVAQREILATTLNSNETAAGPSMHFESAQRRLSKSRGAPDREKANLALHRDLLIALTSAAPKDALCGRV